MKIKALLVLLMAVVLSACNKDPQQVVLEGKTMGTTYHVKYIDDGSVELPKSQEVKAALDSILKVVNDEMSTYQKDSQISRFNQMQEINQPFEISPDFAFVVKEAIRLHTATEHALNVTVGPLVNLWGFGPDKRLNKVPSAEQIAERAQFVGIDKFTLENNILTKKVPGVYLDLSSIAKGFGVDKLALHLEQYGIKNYLVEIGGELRGKGKNLQGQDWRIAIEKPELVQGAATQIIVPLHNLGMATSGNYRNYFEDESGKRLSHIIDPKTLSPIEHNLASITVIAPSTMTADGLSTGLFVLGPEKALEVAERDQLAVFLIIKNGDKFETKMSSTFAKLTEQK
ncbi:thiamine biosynthesis protein ApbE [Pasteurellaceae bacterium LFhippo2]|nr:thiamine biosynthesis protein ApbE [Pasteurellaceae bacterium LFhippo2]